MSTAPVPDASSAPERHASPARVAEETESVESSTPQNGPAIPDASLDLDEAYPIAKHILVLESQVTSLATDIRKVNADNGNLRMRV